MHHRRRTFPQVKVAGRKFWLLIVGSVTVVRIGESETIAVHILVVLRDYDGRARMVAYHSGLVQPMARYGGIPFS